jgi:limonene-1,2-epoxide hydrolase
MSQQDGIVRPIDQELLLRIAVLILRNNVNVTVEAVVPAELDEALARVLRQFPENMLSDAELDALKREIRENAAPNYARHAAAFAFLYFGVNFAKAFLAVSSIPRSEASRFKRIIDLGAGSGASLAGTVAGLKAMLGDACNLCEVVAVDRSVDQLNILEKAVAPWIEETLEEVRVRTVCGDVFDFIAHAESSDSLVVMSYLEAELGESEITAFRERLEKFVPIQKGNAIRTLASAPSRRGLSVGMEGGKSIIIPYDAVHIASPEVGALSSSRRPKFAALDEWQVINEYGRVWREHHMDGLRKLFTPDATYTISPRRKLVGIEQISTYWRENSKTQRNVKFEVVDIIRIANDCIRVMWRAEFERIDTNDVRCLEGMMILGVNEEGRIFNLEESYTQRYKPFET